MIFSFFTSTSSINISAGQQYIATYIFHLRDSMRHQEGKAGNTSFKDSTRGLALCTKDPTCSAVLPGDFKAVFFAPLFNRPALG